TFNQTTASCRGALPEVDRSHPSGSLFLVSPPPSSMSTQTRSQFVATVSENISICREHYRLVLRLQEFPPTEPGQFVQLECRDGDRDYEPDRECDWAPGARGARGALVEVTADELSAPLAMLRRPFSLAGRTDAASGVELAIIHRVV